MEHLVIKTWQGSTDGLSVREHLKLPTIPIKTKFEFYEVYFVLNGLEFWEKFLADKDKEYSTNQSANLIRPIINMIWMADSIT